MIKFPLNDLKAITICVTESQVTNSEWLIEINQSIEVSSLVALCNYKNPEGKCWNNCSSSDNTKAGIFPPNPTDSFFTENIEDWTCRGKYLK